MGLVNWLFLVLRPSPHLQEIVVLYHFQLDADEVQMCQVLVDSGFSAGEDENKIYVAVADGNEFCDRFRGIRLRTFH
jgi:hypothetical protein